MLRGSSRLWWCSRVVWRPQLLRNTKLLRNMELLRNAKLVRDMELLRNTELLGAMELLLRHAEVRRDSVLMLLRPPVRQLRYLTLVMHLRLCWWRRIRVSLHLVGRRDVHWGLQRDSVDLAGHRGRRRDCRSLVRRRRLRGNRRQLQQDRRRVLLGGF